MTSIAIAIQSASSVGVIQSIAKGKIEVKHCGNEKCIGSHCENWLNCRGETIPPWNCKTSPSTASIVISDHDMLEAADELANELEAVIDQNQYSDTVIDCRCERIKQALLKYRNARNGVRN